jgi:hypothetical protein
MKRLLYSAAILTLVSLPIFAATNSKSFNLHQAVTIGSTQLPPGHYKVSWDGTGSNVHVTLFQKNTYGARPLTVNANVVEDPVSHTGISVSRENNVNMLKTMHIGKTEIDFTGSPANVQ